MKHTVINKVNKEVKYISSVQHRFQGMGRALTWPRPTSHLSAGNEAFVIRDLHYISLNYFIDIY